MRLLCVIVEYRESIFHACARFLRSAGYMIPGVLRQIVDQNYSTPVVSIEYHNRGPHVQSLKAQRKRQTLAKWGMTRSTEPTPGEGASCTSFAKPPILLPIAKH
jgi:hypothetical protein